MSSTRSERWQAEVNSRLLRLEALAEESEIRESPFGAMRNGPPSAEEAEAYPDLDTWVGRYFAAVFVRPLGGEFRWCAQWRQHREAVVRLEALWCSWRGLQRDPVMGMSTWFHLHLDPQLGVLLSARGPFIQCSALRHEDGIALSTDSSRTAWPAAGNPRP